MGKEKLEPASRCNKIQAHDVGGRTETDCRGSEGPLG
jgi:hypothetical protein